MESPCGRSWPVSSVQQWLVDSGVGRGDGCCVYALPATNRDRHARDHQLRAIWTSASPGILALRVWLRRFGQSEAQVLFTCDGYTFNGKNIWYGEQEQRHHWTSQRAKTSVSTESLFKRMILSMTCRCKAGTTSSIVPATTCSVVRIGFNEPLFVYLLFWNHRLCVGVHSALCYGSTIINHLRASTAQRCLSRKIAFSATTCGWMMWNWHVSALASGACLVIFDGSPVTPGNVLLWDLAARRCLCLVHLPKYLESDWEGWVSPIDSHSLPC